MKPRRSKQRTGSGPSTIGLDAVVGLRAAALVACVALGPVASGTFAAPYVPDPGSEAYASVLCAGGDLHLAKDGSVTGGVHANGGVSLSSGTVIDGDLSSVGAIDLGGATVTGSVSSPAPTRQLPALPTDAEAQLLADQVIEGDHDFPDGTIVDDIVYVAGTARFEGSVNGIGTVIAGTEIRFDNVNPNDTVVLDSGTRMSFVSLGDLWVGKGRPLRGLLVAAGSVDVHKELELEGSIVAGGALTVAKDAVVSYLLPGGGDATRPTVSILSPYGRLVGETPTEVSIVYADGDTGVDPSSLQVMLNGIASGTVCNAGSDAATCSFVALGSGDHRLDVQVSDHAGNTGMARQDFTFIADLQPPILAITEPADGAVLTETLVRVEGTAIDESNLTVAVNGFAVGTSAGTFGVSLNLPEGAHELRVTALDEAGRSAETAITVSVDSVPPVLVVEAPRAGLTNQASIRVAGTAEDSSGVARVEVAGVEVTVTDGAFEYDVALMEGDNLIEVRAFDPAGNVAAADIEIERFTLPQVAIESPVDLSYLAATTVDVSGSVSDATASVKVNGVPAIVSGTSFTASGVPLIEGGNVLTATVTDAQGHVATATIHVVRDLTPPRVAIYQPATGATVYDGTVPVSGLINDIVPGTVNATEASVTVNGIPAQIVNRSFLAENVPLAPGDNPLVATAVDAAGNVRESSANVYYDTAPTARIRVVSGNSQAGTIRTLLPQPLLVELRDAAGLPVAGQPVVFRLKGNDGALDGGRRQLAINSDAAGRARCHFTLGGRAGVASQVVEASAAGFAGPAVFTASALPSTPAMIVVDSGSLQVGVAGRRVPRPLIAAVVDSGHNRLAGVPVVFEVVKGLGTFNDGTQSTVLATDSDGRAIVTFILDPEEGIANNVVAARLQDLEDGPVATFVASGRAAGDPVATSISGVVLDNTNEPIEGVTARVKNTALTAVTDAEGQFRIDAAPVGSVKLIIDGSTADQPGAWPDLEFDLVTIAGRDNTVNMPIFLLPLDLANGLYVDETEGGTLTLPQVPGFALDIEPGSVTFPTGGRSGLVSVTVVHSDRVPMVPNFGQQPRLIVTIQPAGARFEPPARMTLPNVEGLAPGVVTEMYSFDHDLGHFVSLGPATVSDDGMMIRSDSGVGIVKAGWHCGGFPALFGTPNECPECAPCNGIVCEPVSSSVTCDDGYECTFDDHCEGVDCVGTWVRVDEITGPCLMEVGIPSTFTAEANNPARVRWDAPSGTPSTGMGGAFATSFGSIGPAVVNAGCDGSQKSKKVEVAASCPGAEVPPELIEVELEHETSDHFGEVKRLDHSANYAGCGNDGQWCFRLQSLTEIHSVAVLDDANSYKIDISGGDDGDINADNCFAVILDLVPPPHHDRTGPIRTRFYSKEISKKHEGFHVTDFREKVSEKTMNELADFVRNTDCTTCKEPTPESVFDAEMERLWDENYDAYTAGDLHEVRANAHVRQDYYDLILAIRAEATAKGWACR